MYERFVMSTKAGQNLGGVYTLDELYGFLCGYEYYARNVAVRKAEHASS